jgi:hypothetical protein
MEKMFDLRRTQPTAMATLSGFLCFSTVFALTACSSGSGSGSQLSVMLAPVASASADNSSSATGALSLTPFSEAVHDYVIRCAGAPTVQLTVKVPSTIAFGLIEPSGVPVAPQYYPSGQFQRTMAMSPGQRLQFSLSNQTENYSVRCLPADFPALAVSVAGESDIAMLKDGVSGSPLAQWYVFALGVVLTPTTPTPPSYVIIADVHGVPIWWKREPLGVLDAKVLSGSQIAWTSQTAGKYFIRNFSGTLLNKLTGNIDEHELQVTPQGTNLVIQTVQRVCPPDCADMSPWGGSATAAVIDAEIHEIDNASNVIWKWRTRDHIALYETGEESWFPGVGNDIIHMNAVAYVDSDHLLFSARHLNAIYSITKSTGAIDWKIGGAARPESLTVTEDTRPTALGPAGMVLNGQHDVRSWPDGTVSVHDNGTDANRPPSVVRYQIDTSSKTAEVVEEFSDPRVKYSLCCGSARRISDGHWLVDWGDNTLTTEMVQGLPVLTIQYASSGLFSYRAVPVLPGIVSADTLRNGMDAMAAANQ